MMQIGIPKESLDQEYRVGATPMGVESFVAQGASVCVESGAGQAIGFCDAQYVASGAKIVSKAEAFSQDLVLKVKEPNMDEVQLMHASQVLFCYLHLAAKPALTQELMRRGITAIAYETITKGRTLPLLEPMSEIAGRLSIQAGIRAMELHEGGSGVLLGGVPGVLPSRVVVIGAGVSGCQALRVALGLEADVTVLDIDLDKLRALNLRYPGRLKTVHATPASVREAIVGADLVVGAVLSPGKKAPQILTRNDLALLKPRAVLVDIAIDQGGCFQTSAPTTHKSPTFVIDDVIHYCVSNMPGAVAKTATLALTNASFAYVEALLRVGCMQALAQDVDFCRGLNVAKGYVTCEAVAQDLGLPYRSAFECVESSV